MAYCHTGLFVSLLMVMAAAATLTQLDRLVVAQDETATYTQSVKSTYADCSTNFNTLERALVETDNNRFRLVAAFYPPREAVSVYVDVTYTFKPDNETDNDTLIEKWIWTSGSFYLIEPPNVFRFTSLFFVYPEEGRIRKLDVTLPGACRKVTRTRNRKHENDEGMLEILTQRVSAYSAH